jgi:hypothetical protein
MNASGKGRPSIAVEPDGNQVAQDAHGNLTVGPVKLAAQEKRSGFSQAHQDKTVDLGGASGSGIEYGPIVAGIHDRFEATRSRLPAAVM